MDDEESKNNRSIDDDSFHLYNNNSSNQNDSSHHHQHHKNNHVAIKHDLRSVPPIPIKEEKYQRSTASGTTTSTNHDNSKRFSEELNDSLELSMSHRGTKNALGSGGELVSCNGPLNGPTTTTTTALNESGGDGHERTRENLDMALERIEELENELAHKTQLVNDLLMSKDEILNAKYKEMTEADTADLCKLSNTSMTSLSTSLSVDDISAHLEVLQNKIQNFFEYEFILFFVYLSNVY